MSRIKFKIRLKPIHDKAGLSAYAVARDSSVSENTVRKYTDKSEIISPYLPGVVLELCKFYGVDWKDPTIVEAFIESSEEGITKTLLALA